MDLVWHGATSGNGAVRGCLMRQGWVERGIGPGAHLPPPVAPRARPGARHSTYPGMGHDSTPCVGAVAASHGAIAASLDARFSWILVLALDSGGTYLCPVGGYLLASGLEP